MPVDVSAQLVASVVIAGLSGGGLVSFIEAVRNRGKDKATTTATLSQATLDFAKALQESANEAQKDTAEARKDANEARQMAREARTEADETLKQMHFVRQEMEMLAYRFRRITGAILDDNVTRDDLKVMVRAPGPGGIGS